MRTGGEYPAVGDHVYLRRVREYGAICYRHVFGITVS